MFHKRPETSNLRQASRYCQRTGMSQRGETPLPSLPPGGDGSGGDGDDGGGD